MSQQTSVVQPGRGLGWMMLGSSLHSVISKVKSLPQTYPKLDLAYSASSTLLQPVILNLPANGLRLRFDGPDQRLRLIEVIDFGGTHVTYKNTDLVKRSRPSENDPNMDTSSQRPSFKHIYNRLFGPAYEGEYIPPNQGHSLGSYVLSYPGLAFSFPIQHKSWSDKADFVSMLSSNATGPAQSMAIFAGSSWPEARSMLFSQSAVPPRPTASTAKHAEFNPDEVDIVRLYGAGRLEFTRRSGHIARVQLSETTPQDLVAGFGPPDATYRKHDNRISIHAGPRSISRRESSISPALDATSLDTDHSSLQSYTDDSDVEPSAAEGLAEEASHECFYNYFRYGFDALISFPKARSPPFPGDGEEDKGESGSSQLVVTKIILHGNVPGSYSFNRHRRCRWAIPSGQGQSDSSLTSEMAFAEISAVLKQIWHRSYGSADEERRMQRGMVLNRGWGESPDSSIELLGGFDDALPRRSGQNADMNNTELFGFPGMLFEVLKNDAISCVTIY